MLYVLYGDPVKCFSKSEEIIKTIISKNPEVNVLSLNQENYQGDKIPEYISGRGLFVQKYIVKISRPSRDKNFLDALVANLKELKGSENIFIWIDPEISATELKRLEKYCEKVQKLKKENKIEKKENLFALTDALGKRDQKQLWLLYINALKKFRPEEIHGLLWWQIKNMLLINKTSNQDNTGLKPFVFNKSKSFLKNYSPQELEKLSDEMIKMLYESRNGGPSLEIAIEKFILSL